MTEFGRSKIGGGGGCGLRDEIGEVYVCRTSMLKRWRSFVEVFGFFVSVCA